MNKEHKQKLKEIRKEHGFFSQQAKNYKAGAEQAEALYNKAAMYKESIRKACEKQCEKLEAIQSEYYKKAASIYASKGLPLLDAAEFRKDAEKYSDEFSFKSLLDGANDSDTSSTLKCYFNGEGAYQRIGADAVVWYVYAKENAKFYIPAMYSREYFLNNVDEIRKTMEEYISNYSQTYEFESYVFGIEPDTLDRLGFKYHRNSNFLTKNQEVRSKGKSTEKSTESVSDSNSVEHFEKA